MDFRAAIIKILKTNGSTAGTGFFVLPDYRIITCEHVLDESIHDDGTIFAQYGFSEDCGCQEYLKIQLRRVQDLSQEIISLDIAILEVVSSELPPTNDFKAIQFTYEELHDANTKYKSYGFPINALIDGMPATCTIVGSIKDNKVVLNSSEISVGFSGGPVWSEENKGVIGIVRSISSIDPYGKQRDTVFMVPGQALSNYLRPKEIEQIDVYKGLSFFDVKDSKLYFGRDENIQELFATLKRDNIVLLIGVSGSGKSSLVRAGIQKGLNLRQNRTWMSDMTQVVMNIGQNPISNLIFSIFKEVPRSLADILKSALNLFFNEEATEQEIFLATKSQITSLDVSQIADALKNAFANHRLLLVIDQFERLYTDCDDQKQRDQFIDLIISSSNPNIKFLLAARNDFYKEILSNSKLAEATKHSKIDLLEMNDEEITQAIEMPAVNHWVSIEKSLINQLVEECKNQQGKLPLLQFALQQIWKVDAKSGMLTMLSYTKLSTYVDGKQEFKNLDGLIIKKAEEIFESLTENEKICARNIFVSLIAFKGQALIRKDTSKRVEMTKFDEQTKSVVKKLADSFLLTTDFDEARNTSIVGVSHEALLRSWPRLIRWLDSLGPYLAWYNADFSPFFEQWVEHNRQWRFLLGYSTANTAFRFLRRFNDKFEGAEKIYVRRSFLKNIFLVSTLVILAGIGLFIISRAESQDQKEKIIIASGLVEQGDSSLMCYNYNGAFNYFLDALKIDDRSNTREKIANSLTNAVNIISKYALSGDLVGTNEEGTLGLYFSKYNRAEIVRFSTQGKVDSSNQFPFRAIKGCLSKNGKIAIIGSESGELKLWHIGKSHDLITIPHYSSKIASVIISSDNNLVAYSDESKNVFIYNIAKQTVDSLKYAGDHINWALAFSNDCKRMYSGGADYYIRCWELKGNSWDTIFRKSVSQDVIMSIAVSEDDKKIAIGGSDAVIAIGDARSGVIESRINGSRSAIISISFFCDGRAIIAGGDDGSVSYWDIVSKRELHQFHPENIIPTGIFKTSQFGELVLGYKSGGSYKVNFLNNPLVSSLYDHTMVNFKAIALSRNGDYLAASGLGKSYDKNNNEITIWDLKADTILKHIQAHSDDINGLAFDNNSNYLISVSADSSCKIWHCKSWTLANSFSYAREIDCVSFSNDNQAYFGGMQIENKAGQPFSYIDRIKDITQPTIDTPFIVKGGSTFSMANSGNGFLVCGTGINSSSLWNVVTSKEIFEDTVKMRERSIWAIAIANRGDKFASGSTDHKLRLFEISQASNSESVKIKLTDTLSYHSASIYGLVYSPDGKWLISGSVDQSICIRDLENNRTYTINFFNAPIYSIQFSTDGKKLYLSGLKNNINVLDFEIFTAILRSPQQSLPIVKGI